MTGARSADPATPGTTTFSRCRDWIGQNATVIRGVTIKIAVVVMLVMSVTQCGLFDGPTGVIMHVTAETRSVSYRVSNPAFSSITFPAEVFMRADHSGEGQCLEGVATLTEGALVRYAVGASDLLLISIERETGDGPIGLFSPSSAGGGQIELRDGAALIYGANSGCRYGGAVLLPIWGATSIGETPNLQSSGASRGVPGPVLLDGRIEVFGVSRVSGETRPSMYPANTVPLPAGAMVRNRPPSTPHDATPDILRGFALYGQDNVMSRGLNALSLSLTGDVDSLELFRWGSGVDGELIAIQPLAELFGDPSKSRLMGMLLAVFALLGALYGFWHFIRPMTYPPRRRRSAQAKRPLRATSSGQIDEESAGEVVRD